MMNWLHYIMSHVHHVMMNCLHYITSHVHHVFEHYFIITCIEVYHAVMVVQKYIYALISVVYFA